MVGCVISPIATSVSMPVCKKTTSADHRCFKSKSAESGGDLSKKFLSRKRHARRNVVLGLAGKTCPTRDEFWWFAFFCLLHPHRPPALRLSRFGVSTRPAPSPARDRVLIAGAWNNYPRTFSCVSLLCLVKPHAPRRFMCVR